MVSITLLLKLIVVWREEREVVIVRLDLLMMYPTPSPSPTTGPNPKLLLVGFVTLEVLNKSIKRSSDEREIKPQMPVGRLVESFIVKEERWVDVQF